MTIKTYSEPSLETRQDRREASVIVEPTIDRTALWMTIRGAVPTGGRTQFLSLPEAKTLAQTLWHQVKQLERKPN